MKLFENVNHDIFIRFVKVSRRLVGKNDLGMVDKRACNADALLLAAGKLAWEMLCSVLQSNALQRFESFLFIGHAVVILRYHHIFNSGEIIHQMELLEDKPDFIAADFRQLPAAFLGDICAVENDLAERRLIHTADNIHHSGLSRAGGSHNCEPFAVFYGEVHIIKRL